MSTEGRSVWRDRTTRPNRYLAHSECAYAKTYGKDGDLARIAKAKAQKRAIYGLKAPKRPLSSAPMAKAAPQRRASGQLSKPPLPRRALYVPQPEGSRP